MVIVDTSIWIDVFRDASGARRQVLTELVDPEEVMLTAFSELELLQGCRNDDEWALLRSYLDTQEYADPNRETWARAARIYFDLRRRGRTVRSPIDCCIAAIAIQRKSLLLHRDSDFVTISQVTPLEQRLVEW